MLAPLRHFERYAMLQTPEGWVFQAERETGRLLLLVGAAVVMAVAAASIEALRDRLTSVLGIALVFALGPLMALVDQRRVVVHPGGVRYEGRWIRTRELPLHEVARVLVRRDGAAQGKRRRAPVEWRVFFQDRSDGIFPGGFRLAGEESARELARQLSELLSVPVTEPS